MKVVITGANGFVGQHLQRELKHAWPDVAITGWDLPAVDITKSETYREHMAAIQPDWVVHVAALVAVGGSEGAHERYRAVNAIGTEAVLETMQAVSPASRALVVSSAEVYGLTESARAGQPVSELSLAECRPGNPYAESKLAMERIIEDRFLSCVVRVRPFPHFGPGQKTGFVTSDFAAQIAAIEASGAPGVLRVGNLTTRRDFTDVRDVVRAYRLLMERNEVGEVFNVGSGKAWTIQHILDQLLKLSSAKVSVEQDPALLRPVDIPVVVGDAGKLTAATGWQPTVPLEESLRDILDYWRRVGT